MANSTNDGSQHYEVGIGIDKTQAEKDMEAVNRKFSELGKTAVESGSQIDATFKKIGAGIASYFAVGQIETFIGKVVETRKEFQSLEVAFSSLLGSEKLGKEMFKAITDFATSTPLLEKDLANGAKTLLGFNIEAEKVIPYLKQIGDVSMGDSQKFQSLTLAFAQIQSTGKLMGQDLLQLINAGFNPLGEIARTTGKSISELKQEMSDGKISAEMVADAFASATSEGGKFNGMLESQAKTLAGASSNLEGAIQKFENSIGEKLEPTLVEFVNKGYDTFNDLAHVIEGLSLTEIEEDFRRLATAVAAVASVYGTYKAAAMTAHALNAMHAARITSLVRAFAFLRRAILETRAAQLLLNSALLANPYVLAATAISALVAGMVLLANKTDGATQATIDFQNHLKELEEQQQKSNEETEKAISLATDDSKANEERQKGIQSLVKKYGSIIQKYIDEEGHLKNIIELKREIARIDGAKSVSDLREDSDNYAKLASYARVARSKQMNTSQSMDSTERANYEKALQEYMKKTGNSRFNTSATDVANYFEGLSRQSKRAAGTKATQINVDNFGDSIGSMSSKKLKEWQAVLKNAQELSKSGKLVNVSGISKGLTGEQINSLLTQVNGAVQSRQTKTVTKDYSYWEKQKKDAETALKAIPDSKKDSAEWKKQADLIEEANKHLKVYNDTKREGSKNQSGKTAAQIESERLQKQVDADLLEAKMAKDRERQEQDLSDRLYKLQLDNMEEGEEKKLALMRYNADRERTELEREAEDAVEAEIERQRRLFDASENEKAVGNKTYAKKVFGEANYDKDAINAIQQQYQSLIDGLLKKEEKAQADMLALSISDMEEYLIKYGEYEEQKKALNDKYNKLIAKAETEGAKLSLQKELKEALSNLDMKNLQKSINWETIFNQLDTLSVKELEKLKEKLQKMLHEGIVTPENAKILSEQILAITKQITSKKDFLSSLLPGMNKRKQGAGADKNAKFKLTDLFSFANEGPIGVTQGVNANIQGFNELVDTLGLASTDFGKAVGKFAEGSNFFMSAVQNILSGNIFGAVSDIIKGFESWGEAIFGGADYSGWEKAVKKYSGLVDVWGEVLQDQKELISEAKGAYQSVKAYNDSINTLNKERDATKAMARARLGAGASIGSHSLNYRMWEGSYESAYGRTWNDVNRQISSKYGVRFDSMSDLLNMNSDTLKDIKSQYADLWAAMDDEFRKYLESIIEYGETESELIDQLNEKLTGTTFDSMVDSFESALMDMDKDVSEFADDFSKTLAQAMLNSQFEELYADDIRKLYNRMAEMMRSNGGKLTAENVADLQESYQKIVQNGIELRDQISQITGYDSQSSSQTATANAVQSITADQANQLVGRITAMQIAVEKSTSISKELQVSVQSAIADIKLGTTLLDENNSLTRKCSAHLEQIASNTAYLPLMDDKLDRIYRLQTDRL